MAGQIVLSHIRFRFDDPSQEQSLSSPPYENTSEQRGSDLDGVPVVEDSGERLHYAGLMPAQLRLIKSEEPRALFRADARLRLWGAAACGVLAIGFTAVGYDARVPPVLAGPLAAAFLLWSLYLLVTFAARRSERYTLTPQRLEIERGILSRQYENLELWRIREVILEQTLVERLRGAGRLTLVAADALQPSMMIGPVSQARAFYEALIAARPNRPAEPRRSGQGLP